MLDNIMLVRTSDSLARNINSLTFFEKSIQQTRITLVVYFRLTKTSIWARRADFDPKKTETSFLKN